MSTWTRFMDMHSGGGTKEPPWEYIYIEAPECEARTIFYNRFGHNPERVTCTCCGGDYSISSGELAALTAYDRGCDYVYIDAAGNEHGEDYWQSTTREQRHALNGRYVERQSREPWAKKFATLDEYRQRDDVLFLPASDIKPEWRDGEVPEQGYVWID